MKARPSLGFALTLLLLCCCTPALGANIMFLGQAGYTVDQNTVNLTAVEVRNVDPSGVSGNLRLELWAYPLPFDGTPQTGYRLAFRDLGQLATGASLTDISGTVPFTPPPFGTWYFTMHVTEFTGADSDNGYTIRATQTFPTAVTFGSQAAPFFPTTGLWYSSSESGTGYNIQVRHGVLVMIMYSFTASGDPIWYLMSGPLTENGSKLSATLDKFRNGQCAGCAYNGFPDADGNDGPITIVFTSSTTAFIAFGSGRVVQIAPYNF